MGDELQFALERLFSLPEYLRERRSLPILSHLVERFSQERPFLNQQIAFGHFLVMNSMPILEALWRGGAEVIICEAHPIPERASIQPLLTELGVAILPIEEAVQRGDMYLDVGAVLGRSRTPTAAAEVTRTGVLHYQSIPCPVINADDSRSKLIEGYFGTGDGFIRAWKLLRPEDPLLGKRLVQFGYGKIGRGVAQICTEQGIEVTVVDPDPYAREKAAGSGHRVQDYQLNRPLQDALESADIVVAVTGVPAILSDDLPTEWLRVNRPVLVNLGAEDEFGPNFMDSEVLGGRTVPLNFHLEQPTLNRFVDAPLAAHLLALEVWVHNPEQFPVGIHPLPKEVDDWIVRSWRAHWPEEDLSGIDADLGLQG